MLLQKREPRASTLAPAFSVFLRLTWVPILLAPVVQDVRGQTADLGLAIPIGTLAAALAAPVMRHLAGLRAAERPPRAWHGVGVVDSPTHQGLMSKPIRFVSCRMMWPLETSRRAALMSRIGWQAKARWCLACRPPVE